MRHDGRRCRTILLTRWRTGGRTNFDLVREFASELPNAPAAEAWQRACLLAREAPLEASREPRLKRSDETGECRRPIIHSSGLATCWSTRARDRRVPAEAARCRPTAKRNGSAASKQNRLPTKRRVKRRRTCSAGFEAEPSRTKLRQMMKPTPAAAVSVATVAACAGCRFHRHPLHSGLAATWLLTFAALRLNPLLRCAIRRLAPQAGQQQIADRRATRAAAGRRA